MPQKLTLSWYMIHLDKRLKKIVSSRGIMWCASAIASLLVPFFVFATIYEPGQTLNPDCGPTDLNCGVTAPAKSGANTDITSLGNLTGITSTRGFFPQLFFTTASGTAITSTNAYFGALSVDSFNPMQILTGSVTSTNLYIVGATSLQGLTFTTASGTSITSTDAFFTTLSAMNFNPVNVNTTNVTTTNLFASSSMLVVVSSTNLFAEGLMFSNTTGTSMSLAGSFTQRPLTEPRIVGGIPSSTTYAMSGAWAVKGQGPYVYVGTLSASHDWFSVVNIMDPANPKIVGITSSATSSEGEPGSGDMNNINDIAVSGDYAYVLSGWDLSNPHNNLHVIDISDPTAPTRVGKLFLANTSTQSSDGNQRIVVSGGYAYITNGRFLDSLLVVDISNPENPQLAGMLTSSTLLHNIGGIAVSGKYVYMTSGYTPETGYTGKFIIADISNPTNPAMVSAISVTSTTSSITSVDISGNYAYLPDAAQDALHIVDISSSTNPVVVGSVADSTNLDGIFSVVILGKYAYVGAAVDDSLRIIDISSSTNPVLVGGVKDSMRLDGARSVYISGRYAYVAVANANGGLYVIDLGGSDIHAAHIGSLESGNINIINNLTIGNSVSIANALTVGSGGIKIEGDATVSGLSLTGALYDTTASSGMAGYILQSTGTSTQWIATSSLGYLTSFTESDPVWMMVSSSYLRLDGGVMTGALTTPSSTIGVLTVTSSAVFSGGLLFADASGTSVTTTNLFSSALSFTNAMGGNITSTNLFAEGFMFSSATGTSLLLAGSFTQTPYTEPRIVGHIASSTGGTINGAWALDIQGKYAYVGTTRSGDEHFNVIDISNPNHPVVVGTLLGQGNSGNRMNDIRDVVVAGQYAYVLSSHASTPEDNLHVIDISNPTTPTHVTRFSITTTSTAGLGQRIAVSGAYLYITNSVLDSFIVIDISNPRSPVPIGSIVSSTLMNTVREVEIRGAYAYIGGQYAPADGGASLVIADISDPYNPMIAGSVTVSTTVTSSIYGVEVSGRYAYITDVISDSVYVIDISSSTNPTVVGNITDSVNLDGPYAPFSVVGKYAYVGSRLTDALRIIDISSSTNPILVGGIQDSARLDNPSWIKVVGKYVYVTSYFNNGGFSIIDLGGIDSPVAHIGALQSSNISVMENITIGNNAYVSNALNVGSGGIKTDGLLSGGALAISMSMDPVIVGRVVSTTALGGAADVAVSGKYAYVSNNSDDYFSVVDISNPTSPVIVGVLNDPDVLGVESVYVSGNYVYGVNFMNDSLVTIDISNPSNPLLVNTFSSSLLDSAREVYISGKYAYITSYNTSALRIVDISNPLNPFVVGGVVSTTALGGANAVHVSGKYAYVGTENNDSLRIIDVSDPTTPTIVGGVASSTLMDWVRSVYVSGNYAYVASYSGDSLTIIDISNPVSPRIVGALQDHSLLDGAWTVKVAGKYAYVVASLDHALRIIDISSSTNPRIVGGIQHEDSLLVPYALEVSGKYAYVGSNYNNALNIIDLGGIDAPTAHIGALQSSNISVTENLTIGNNAYVANALNVGSGGIKTDGGISLTNTFVQTPPAKPFITGSVTSSILDDAVSVSVFGKYAYVASYSANSVSIVDVSTPTNPTIVGSIASTTLDGANSIFVSGKYAYVTGANADGISIVDVSTPTNPTIVGSIASTTLDDPTSVFVSGKYAYVTSWTNSSLSVIDISNSISPTVVANISSSTITNPTSVFVSGKYAYVTGANADGISIVDVSTPTNPTIVGSVSSQLLDGANSIFVSGKYAYVTNYNNFLSIVDVSTPTNPTIVGSVSDWNFIVGTSITVSGKYAYVTDPAFQSLSIVDVSTPTNPTIVGSVSDFELEGIVSVSISGKYAYVVNSVKDSLAVVNIGGIDAPSAHIGSLQSSNVNITDSLLVGNHAYISNGLNVGMGGIKSDGGLVITGADVFMPGLIAPSSTSDVLCLQPDGRITHQASNCTVSSERFKHDIESWNDGLSTIMQLRPVSYKRNYDEVEELGLIAEEVDLVDKHFVIYEPNATTTPRSVDYERLVIPLISAVQAQQAQIDGLILAYAGVSSTEPGVTSEEELLYAANRPLTSALNYLVEKISGAAFVVKDFVAERVTAMIGVFHKVKVETGIEMTDQETGVIYCVEMRGGELMKRLGSCSDTSGGGFESSHSDSVYADESATITTDIPIEFASTTDTSAYSENLESQNTVPTTTSSTPEITETVSTILTEIFVSPTSKTAP